MSAWTAATNPACTDWPLASLTVCGIWSAPTMICASSFSRSSAFAELFASELLLLFSTNTTNAAISATPTAIEIAHRIHSAGNSRIHNEPCRIGFRVRILLGSDAACGCA